MIPHYMRQDAEVPTPPQQENRGDRALWALTAAGGLAYAAQGLWYVSGGLLNGDEGWYLYGARLVYQGSLPYADFTFTQMPLVAYVYGLPQLAVGGIYCGRLTSVVLALAALGVAARAASRLAGPAAAACVTVLLASAPSAIYFSTLIKTYALAAFFLSAMLATLTGPRRREVADPLAAAAAFGLALTRTSGIPIALAVTVGCMWTAPNAIARMRTLAVAAAGTSALAFFVLADFDAARFNLSDIHQVWWYDAPISNRIHTILSRRIPAFFVDYAPYWMLMAAAGGVAALAASGRALIRREPGLVAMFAAMTFFVSTHLLPGQFGSVEYFVPVIPVWLGLCSSVLIFVVRSRHSPRAAAAIVGGCTVLVASITLAHPPVARYAVGTSHPGSVASMNEVARFVREHTRPEDEILALWNQAVSVAADRDTVPGISLGIFSYTARPQAEADALHLITRGKLQEMLEERRPAAVVFSTMDFDQLRKAGTLSRTRLDRAPLLRALDANYERRFTGPGHGLTEPERVYVFLRRGSPSRHTPGIRSGPAEDPADRSP